MPQNLPLTRQSSRPEAYNHRDVMTLKPLTEWTAEEEEIQRKHNRILQPGFLDKPAEEVIRDAKKAKVDWLTDICCPSTEASLLLNIAKELVVSYKVADDQLEARAHDVFKAITEKDPTILASLKEEVDRQLETLRSDTGLLSDTILSEKVETYIKKKNVELERAGRLPLDPADKETVAAISNLIIAAEKKLL